MSFTYRTEPLSPQHDRDEFDCGVAVLNHYLQRVASQDQKRRSAVPFVFAEGQRILGFYTLSSTSVNLESLPESSRKKLPRYPLVPATLIGRLAVDRSARGKRLGERLLMDAMYRALDASSTVASFAVLVDALEIEPDPVTFYEQYGFVRLVSHPRSLYLPMATIAKLPRQ